MEEQKKRNLLTLATIALLIVIVSLALYTTIISLLYEERTKMNNNKQLQNNLETPIQKEDQIENDTEDIIQEESRDKEPKNEEQKPEETKPENPEKDYIGEEENTSKDNQTQSKDEKAIELVKEKYGNDDSVTFSIEQIKGTKYYVAVKSEETEPVWYEVDTETWEVSEY